MIFIMGGYGFVGSAFVRACKHRRLPYKVITRENYSSFVGKRCDVLINANGNSKKYFAQIDPVGEFDASVRSVRSSLVDFEFDRYVYLSSCDVYPDCGSPEITSENTAINVREQSSYGFHKLIAEQCVMHDASSWLVIRLGGLVGPRMRKNPIYDILKHKPLWLDPASELQFIHTGDVAAIVLQLISAGFMNEIFNLCGEGLIRLEEIIDEVGCPVQLRLGSPVVRYDVNMDKLSEIMPVPDTRTTVLQFIGQELTSVKGTAHKPVQVVFAN